MVALNEGVNNHKYKVSNHLRFSLYEVGAVTLRVYHDRNKPWVIIIDGNKTKYTAKNFKKLIDLDIIGQLVLIVTMLSMNNYYNDINLMAQVFDLKREIQKYHKVCY